MPTAFKEIHALKMRGARILNNRSKLLKLRFPAPTLISIWSGGKLRTKSCTIHAINTQEFQELR